MFSIRRFGALVAALLTSSSCQPCTLSPTVCQSTVGAATILSNVTTATVAVGAFPFGLVYSRSIPNIAFVAQTFSLAVLDTQAFPPRLLHTIQLPEKNIANIALSDDNRYVLVTTGRNTLLVVDSVKAATNSPDAVAGVLYAPQADGLSSIQVTPFHNYAFVSQEYGIETSGNLTTADPSQRGGIEVFQLDYPSPKTNSTVSGNFTGYLQLDYAVVGQALSQQGRFLYVTNEAIQDETPGGTLSILSTEKLITDPSNAILGNVSAGCEPVRVIDSADGKHVWVSARASNALLAFDAEKLLHNSSSALAAAVQTGPSPVDLLFVKDGSRIITADSNRSEEVVCADNPAGFTVVDVEAALRGDCDKANLGTIPTNGLFPRELALSPDGCTILASLYCSNEVLAIRVDSLP